MHFSGEVTLLFLIVFSVRSTETQMHEGKNCFSRSKFFPVIQERNLEKVTEFIFPLTKWQKNMVLYPFNFDNGKANTEN